MAITRAQVEAACSRDGKTIVQGTRAWADAEVGQEWDVFLTGDSIRAYRLNIRYAKTRIRGQGAYFQDCRFYRGSTPLPDAMNDAIEVGATGVVLDHCDICWSTDDGDFVTGNTVAQYCLIGDPLKDTYNHPLGIVIQDETGTGKGFTFYRCLFVHSTDRPLITDNTTVRFVECVFFNVDNHLIVTTNPALGVPTSIYKRCVTFQGLSDFASNDPGDVIVRTYAVAERKVNLYMEDCLCPRRPTNDLDINLAWRQTTAGTTNFLSQEPAFPGDPLPEPGAGGWAIDDVVTNVLANVGARPHSAHRNLVVQHAQDQIAAGMFGPTFTEVGIATTVDDRGGWFTPA